MLTRAQVHPTQGHGVPPSIRTGPKAPSTGTGLGAGSTGICLGLCFTGFALSSQVKYSVCVSILFLSRWRLCPHCDEARDGVVEAVPVSQSLDVGLGKGNTGFSLYQVLPLKTWDQVPSLRPVLNSAFPPS